MIHKGTMKKLGFGCMRLPVMEQNQERIDREMFCRMIDRYMEQGFSYFDTAYPYHNEQSEEAIRHCLVERYARDRFVLADKMPVWMIKEYSDFERIFQVQLRRCGVDYFDFYLLHALDAGRIRDMEEQGGFRFLQEMKAQGKIKNIGFSFHDTAEVLEQALARHPELDFVQLQINYYDWDSQTVQSKKCYEAAVRHNIPVIVMEPVKGGTLANLAEQPAEVLRSLGGHASMASYAIRYAASLDQVLIVLSGMSNQEQLEDNISYMQTFEPLSDREQEAIAQVVQALQQILTIACTKCRYCVAGCPEKIQIPELFEAYNKAVQFGVTPVTRRGYEQAVSDGHGAPDACLLCGQCEGQCPQHLPIRELLTKVTEKF